MKKNKMMIPTKWGTSNPSVNQTMSKKAQDFVFNLEKTISLYKEDKRPYSYLLLCFEEFFKSFKAYIKTIKNEDIHSIQIVMLSFSEDFARASHLDWIVLENVWRNTKND